MPTARWLTGGKQRNPETTSKYFRPPSPKWGRSQKNTGAYVCPSARSPGTRVLRESLSPPLRARAGNESFSGVRGCVSTCVCACADSFVRPPCGRNNRPVALKTAASLSAEEHGDAFVCRVWAQGKRDHVLEATIHTLPCFQTAITPGVRELIYTFAKDGRGFRLSPPRRPASHGGRCLSPFH